jgi:hypothetical protein
VHPLDVGEGVLGLGHRHVAVENLVSGHPLGNEERQRH